MTVAYTTGSGTAVMAVTASQLASTPWGQFALTMIILSYIMKTYVDYIKACMIRQTLREHMAIIEKQMEYHARSSPMFIPTLPRSTDPIQVQTRATGARRTTDPHVSTRP
jgi:hypothetical protein